MTMIYDNNLSKAARVVREALESMPERTYAELIEETNYNERHLRRALDELRANGVEIEARGRPKRFSIPQEMRRRPYEVVPFNEDELLALRLAAEVAESTFRSTPIAESLQSGFEKLMECTSHRDVMIDVASQARAWHFSDAPSGEIRTDVFEDLRHCVRERTTVAIDYYSASSEEMSRGRKVDPWCIAERSGSWLLVAWCHQSNGVREFNLVDISSTKPIETDAEPDSYDRYEKEFDPDIYFRDRFRAVGGDQVFEVRLLVEAKNAPYFRRKIYHPTQQIEERRDDGRIVVSYEVEGLEELRSFAQSWGTGVTVLEPEELREVLREQAGVVMARYGG